MSIPHVPSGIHDMTAQWLAAALGRPVAEAMPALAERSMLLHAVLTLNGWDAMPQRSRTLCLTLTDRAVMTIDVINALEVFA